MSIVILTGPENIQPWLHSLARRARHSGCYHILFPSTTSSSSSSSSTSLNGYRSEGIAHKHQQDQQHHHHRSSSNRRTTTNNNNTNSKNHTNTNHSNTHSSSHHGSHSSHHGPSSGEDAPQHLHHLQGIADRLQRETACRLVRESVPGPIWAYMLTLVVDADELFADPALAVRMARVAAARAPDAPITDRDWHRLRYELRGGIPDDYPTRAHYEQGQKWLDTVTKRHRLGQGLL